MLGEPKPPRRDPHYSWNESQGWTYRECARALIDTLSHFVRTPVEFQGAAHGRIWSFKSEHTDRAELSFTSDHGDGVIALSIHDSGWVRAEIFVDGALKFRAWVEDPWEEKDFWPDDADGIGEAPGRISKRGSWLNIERARFPGVIPGEKPFLAIEDVTANVVEAP
jgi:hypothetical protein